MRFRFTSAIRSGHGTTAIYNNLAASYLDGASNLSPTERLQAVERNLAKAYSLEPTSPSVNLNYVRLAIKRSERDATFDPVTGWQYAKPLLGLMGENEYVRLQLAFWCNCISKRAVNGHEALIVELRQIDDPKLQSLIADFDAAGIKPGDIPSPISAKMQLSGTKACYIEPR